MKFIFIANNIYYTILQFFTIQFYNTTYTIFKGSYYKNSTAGVK